MLNTPQIFHEVLELEISGLQRMKKLLKNSDLEKVEKFFQKLIENKSSLFFSGSGKSGLVGMKLASTFSSLGLPSFFIHPNDAMHGDLGKIRSHDSLIILSKSGYTSELVSLLKNNILQK